MSMEPIILARNSLFFLFINFPRMRRKLIIKMVRDVYPHDRFPEAPYERTANDVITKGNADSAKKTMLSEGIENLKVFWCF